MKTVKLLDQEGTALINDPANVVILQKLVVAEHSISELATELNQPTLKMWRRMQKLIKTNLVELVQTKKVGNLEKKMYRATATYYTPHQYFNPKPKDPNLQEALNIYSDIQKEMMTALLTLGDVPKEADPTDFSLFANMQVFVQTCSKSTTQAKIAELKQKLDKFRQQSRYLEKLAV
jgi:DNA-binding transcriptional regulator GbsR (MarR family)